MLSQALLITLLGMLVTFAALALVMTSMFLLTRLLRDRQESQPDQAAAGADAQALAEESELVASVPAGTPLEQVAAVAVAVAVARELARQRHSAQVWLDPQPRSLLTPWQIVARDRQLDRLKQ